ncbi:MAG: hypothetical protein AB1512_18235, partial [Thermodesulfobacteriota bacterium]
MNEWDLQRQLSRIWRGAISIEHRAQLYRLVCWELMFPSWQINYKLRKWNEPSIDFILFDGKEKFLC